MGTPFQPSAPGSAPLPTGWALSPLFPFPRLSAGRGRPRRKPPGPRSTRPPPHPPVPGRSGCRPSEARSPRRPGPVRRPPHGRQRAPPPLTAAGVGRPGGPGSQSAGGRLRDRLCGHCAGPGAVSFRSAGPRRLSVSSPGPPPAPSPGLRRRGAARKRRHWLGWGRHLRPTLRGSRAPPVLARCGLGPPFGCRRAPPPWEHSWGPLTEGRRNDVSWICSKH